MFMNTNDEYDYRANSKVKMDNCITYLCSGNVNLDIHIFDINRTEAEKLMLELGERYSVKEK